MRGKKLTASFDIAIAGSGFAGSLMAMIARRLGYSVALMERGRHPRFAIGESSTPLANLLLEELCRKYGLAATAPLAKWGSWQSKYPHVGCGLKRGFTFYHHRLGPTIGCPSGYEDQLLVAASPHNEISDTHWFRADFDQLLMEQAKEAGCAYFDEVGIDRVSCEASYVELGGVRVGEDFLLRAKFLIDATGPRGLLYDALGIGETTYPNYPVTEALYTHFSGVRRPPEVPANEDPPYPPEDAAVHHVFEGGWIWVLRFNNGTTSAGVAATDRLGAKVGLAEGAAAWDRLLAGLPTLLGQFAQARAQQPFRHIRGVSFLSQRMCGQRWALLPSAAGFVDPLLSTGFPLTLLGVERLSEILEAGFETPRLADDLSTYEQKTREELLATSRLIAALYANMGNFALFRALCLLYFAAASYSETARRLGKPGLAKSFLLHDHPEFGHPSRLILERATNAPGRGDRKDLIAEILDSIGPIDVAGLGKPNARHWYPVDAGDLREARGKVGATADEIEALVARCGFDRAPKH
jgi:tetracycline 7-halogenase / FADH2 O2-dependent halogenase